MTWQIPWPEFLKKRLCRYLLQHYLGRFFKEKISLEQLSIDIYNGTGCVKNLHLDCDALNEQLNSTSSNTSPHAQSTVPIEIVSGFVGYISVYIPWHDLFNDFCKLTIKNVQITIRTKSRRQNNIFKSRKSSDNEDTDSSFSDESDSNSMFSSMIIDSMMNTSMHIAQECLNEEKNLIKSDLESKSGSLLGLEAFASIIDSILSRIKINLEQIQIRIENIENEKPQDIMKSSSLFHHNLSSNGIALELRIKSIKYFDLDSSTPNQSQEPTPSAVRNTTKNFNIEGLTVYFDEFIIRDEFDSNDRNPFKTETSLDSTLESEPNQTLEDPSGPIDECPPFNFELDPNYYLYTNPIIMLTFSGIQSIKLTINNMRPTDLILDAMNTPTQQTASQQRPFLEVSAQFGSIKCLLCPKQIHLLTDMIEKLNEYIEGVNNMKREFKMNLRKNKTRLKPKPVRGCDKKKFESFLQEEMTSSILIDSVDSDNFKSIFQVNDPTANSSMFYSMMSESVHYKHEEKIPEQSDLDEDKNQQLFTRNLKQTIEQLQNDPIKHTLHSNHNLFQTFRITVRQFSLTMLHHDPEKDKNSRLIVERMKNVSDFYFDWSSTIETQQQTRPDKITILKYHQACAFNDHFLLLLKPINLNLTQKINQGSKKGQYSLNDATASAGYIQMNEYLIPEQRPDLKKFKTPQAIELSKTANITEIVNFSDSNQQIEQPCLKAQLTFYDPIEQESQPKDLLSQSFENISLTLNQSLNFELDISIIDRFYYLINDISKPRLVKDASKSETKTKKVRNFEIKCDQVVKIGLRFPIADLSRVHQDKVLFPNEITMPLASLKPAKMINFRNLREQILTLHLFDLTFQTLKNAKSNEQDMLLTLTSSQINAYYQYKKDERPIHFGLIQQKLNEPRSLIVQIKIPVDSAEEIVGQNLTDWKENIDIDSLQHQYNINVGKVVEEKESDDEENENESNYGPFSRTHSMISSEKNRRIVNAGNKSEMGSFMNNSRQNSEIIIKLNVPDLRFLIADQFFLNDVYNCVLNDLLMYVPSILPPIESSLHVYDPENKCFLAPSLSQLIEANLDTEYFSNTHINLHADFDDFELDEKNFHMCKSAILKCDTSSEHEEECCESDNDVSCGKNRVKNTPKKISPKKNIKIKKPKNLLCFILKIDECHLKAFVIEPGKSVDVKYGEFDIKANNFQMCITNSESFKTEDKIRIEKQLISIFTDSVQISHANKQTHQIKHPTNYPSFDALFQNSKTNILISSNDPAVVQTLFNSRSETPTVSIAIKSKFNPQINKKELLVALNFNNLALHHLFTSQTDFWIFQLIDLFNLTDIIVNGYEVPIVVTELHLNVANSCVIYNPVYLKTRALIGFKSLHWSSNVTAESSSTLLVFNIEDIYLFLSKIMNDSFDLKKDFVCVANTDLFEIRILISEEAQKVAAKDRKSALLDLKIRSNMIQFRTCVDSAFTLIELINYIVSDGDLHTTRNDETQLPDSKTISESIPIFKPDETMSLNSPMRNQSFSYNHSIPSPSLTCDIKNLSSSAESVISDMVKEAMNPMTQSVYGQLDGFSRKRNTSMSFDNEKKRMMSHEEEEEEDILYSKPMFGLDDDKENDSFKNDDDEFHLDMPFTDMSPFKSTSSSFSYSSLITNEMKSSKIRPSQSAVIPRKLNIDRRLQFKKRDEFEPEKSESDEEDDDEDLVKDFDIIDYIPGFGEPPKFNKDFEVKILTKKPFELKEDHFKKPLTKIDVLKAPDTYPCPLNVYCVQEISINWFLYGGSDFSENQQEIEETRSRQNSTSSVSTSPHSLKSVSILSSPNSIKYSNNNVQLNKDRYCKAGGRIIKKYDNLNWLTRGGSSRNLDICMEIALHKVKTKIDVFSEMNEEVTDCPYLFRVALAIGDIEVRDKLASSSFNMFLFRYESDTCPKHANSSMIFFKFLCSRSMDAQRLIECDIKVSIQPLRFNIDQDALIFLIEFFQQLASKDLTEFNKNLTAPNFEPKPVDEKVNQQSPQKVFIRKFILAPDLLIKFDFSGKYDKRPDTKMDTLTKLLMVVVQLSNTEIKLKRVYYPRGFLGADKLLQALVKEWISDIQRNQKKNLIKGWGIFNSLIQFFEGFTYLILYPIEQYKRDGRVLCGIQRGSAAFSTCTVLATIELTNRMFQATKNVAEFFYDLVTPHRSYHQQMIGYNGSSNALVDTLFTGVGPNRYVRIRRQPNDIREGLTNAYYVMFEGLNDTAANFMNEISHGREHKGIPGVIGGAIRGGASTVLAPIVLTTEATCNILSGIRNQLKPDEKKDDDQKWKTITFN